MSLIASSWYTWRSNFVLFLADLPVVFNFNFSQWLKTFWPIFFSTPFCCLVTDLPIPLPPAHRVGNLQPCPHVKLLFSLSIIFAEGNSIQSNRKLIVKHSKNALMCVSKADVLSWNPTPCYCASLLEILARLAIVTSNSNLHTCMCIYVYVCLYLLQNGSS